jgi:hypothetical protein
MGFGQGLAFIFNESWAFVRKAWWLALLPSIVPFLSYSAASPFLSESHQEAALWSMLVLRAMLQTMGLYWVLRFLALAHDLAAALAINRSSFRTFLPYFVTISALNFAMLATSRLNAGAAWLTLVVFALFAYPLLSPWSVTAPSGTTVIGPVRSARLVLPHIFWALALLFVAAVPIPLLQLGADAAINAVPEMPLGKLSSRVLAGAFLQAVVAAYSDLVVAVALFVIAHKAGVRISDESRLAATFE